MIPHSPPPKKPKRQSTSQKQKQAQREANKSWWCKMIVTMKMEILPKQNDNTLCSTLPLGIKGKSHLFASQPWQKWLGFNQDLQKSAFIHFFLSSTHLRITYQWWEIQDRTCELFSIEWMDLGLALLPQRSVEIIMLWMERAIASGHVNTDSLSGTLNSIPSLFVSTQKSLKAEDCWLCPWKLWFCTQELFFCLVLWRQKR